RPEVQPARRARAAEGLRPGTAMHPYDAASRRTRRARQDVEVARQLCRHRRAAAGDVRQAHVDLRRADVALHRAAFVRIAADHRALEASTRARCESPRTHTATCLW